MPSEIWSAELVGMAHADRFAGKQKLRHEPRSALNSRLVGRPKLSGRRLFSTFRRLLDELDRFGRTSRGRIILMPRAVPNNNIGQPEGGRPPDVTPAIFRAENSIRSPASAWYGVFTNPKRQQGLCVASNPWTNSHQAVAVTRGPAGAGTTRKNREGVELLLPPDLGELPSGPSLRVEDSRGVQTGGRVAASVSEAPEGGDTLLATGVNLRFTQI